MEKKQTAAKSGKSAFWKRVQELVAKPRRRGKGVNLSRLGEITKEGETVVVVDKVLGTGKIAHKLTLAAKSFSASAATGLKAAGCKIVTFAQLQKDSPKGTGVRIIK